MKTKIIFPMATVERELSIDDSADNNDIADIVCKSFQTLYKVKSAISKLSCVFDVDEDGLVSWISREGFKIAHGVIYANSVAMLEVWVRVYDD